MSASITTNKIDDDNKMIIGNSRTFVILPLKGNELQLRSNGFTLHEWISSLCIYTYIQRKKEREGEKEY